MDFNFHMPAQIISGENCVSRYGTMLRSLGRRCLIITSGHAAQVSGALDDMMEILKKVGVDATIFPGIGANPLLSQCQTAAYVAETCRAEFIIGIGGGSVMDASKATAWLSANNSTATEMLMKGTLRHPPLPLVLVGTTAGTGSEVSPVAVLTMDKENRKRSISHYNCYAKVVFADPRYTYTTSYKTTVSTALDAFAHAVEGWFAPNCGDVISCFGEKALPFIVEGLNWLAQHKEQLPDPALREQLYYGSLWAGMVLNATGTAFPHPLGYVLTEDFGIDHGMACAVFLPAFLQRAEKYAPQRAIQLFNLCGGREHVVAILDTLVRCDVKMSEEQVNAYKERWNGVKNFDRTPGGFSSEDATALYSSLFVR